MAEKCVILLFLSVLVVAVYITPSDSACCISNSGVFAIVGKCEDGSTSSPCCGYGKCDFFCCNCVGGCRKVSISKKKDKKKDNSKNKDKKKKKTKKYGLEEDQLDAFDLFDEDFDDRISYAEATLWIASGRCGDKDEKLPFLEDNFNVLDQDGDGFLDRFEMGA